MTLAPVLQIVCEGQGQQQRACVGDHQDSPGLNWSGSCGGGEKWSYSEHTLEAEPIGIPGGLDVGSEIQKSRTTSMFGVTGRMKLS